MKFSSFGLLLVFLVGVGGCGKDRPAPSESSPSRDSSREAVLSQELSSRYTCPFSSVKKLQKLSLSGCEDGKFEELANGTALTFSCRDKLILFRLSNGSEVKTSQTLYAQDYQEGQKTLLFFHQKSQKLLRMRSNSAFNGSVIDVFEVKQNQLILKESLRVEAILSSKPSETPEGVILFNTKEGKLLSFQFEGDGTLHEKGALLFSDSFESPPVLAAFRKVFLLGKKSIYAIELFEKRKKFQELEMKYLDELHLREGTSGTSLSFSPEQGFLWMTSMIEVRYLDENEVETYFATGIDTEFQKMKAIIEKCSLLKDYCENIIDQVTVCRNGQKVCVPRDEKSPEDQTPVKGGCS